VVPHTDPDPTFHSDVDPDLDPDPSFQKKSQTIEKMLKYIPYILACQLQIDADPDPDPAYHFDADLDPHPDPDFYLMRMQIRMEI
jgi:hypothetical protein